MKKDKYFLNVYDTLSQSYRVIEVSESVYKAYKRDEWLTRYKGKRFRKNETVFSGLIGGSDEGYDSFQEFISEKKNPELSFVRQETRALLYEAIKELTEEELYLIKALYHEGKSQRALAKALGVSAPIIGKRNKYLLDKLKKYFD